MDSICFDSCHHDFLNLYDMNIQEKIKRLQELLEQNIKHENVGTAIAITGSWGVGKTYFWKSFLDSQLSEERIYKKDNVFNRKYAYVSLFGLESLSDLKTQIYSSIENYHSTIEIPKWVKGLPAIFKDTKISQLGISASAKVFDNLMFNNVKDAIICFDDFERMSNKLDIKDVMGLANQLKLEKNCQVILILDESKTEGENKSKYAEYKEKLIDETIIINSVEPLIREFSQGMDERLIELMIKFADSLEIHNFRFFQKVINLYKNFRKELPDEVAYSTEEIILVRILQGYLIADYGHVLGIDWKGFTIEKAVEILNKNNDDLESIEDKNYKKLYDILPNLFSSVDGWVIQFKNWFEQKDQLNKDILHDLANSELISERVNILKEAKSKLWDQFWNNQIDDNFPKKIYESVVPLIGVEDIENLDFTCTILIKLGADQLADELKEIIYQWINKELRKDQLGFIQNFASWKRSKNCFYDYIDKYQQKNLYRGLPSLLETVHQYTIQNGWSPEHKRSLEVASTNDWKELLFEKIPNDERFQYVHSNLIASKMIRQAMKPEINPKIRQMIVEIYKEKGQESEFYKKYMDYLISRLDN